MMRPIALPLIVAWALAPLTALAETPGIQNHKVQLLFIESPCTEVMKTIDDAQGLEGAGWMAMAFGFLMGFEAAHPGIRGDSDTILMRLRNDCTEGDTRSAMEILQGYAQE